MIAFGDTQPYDLEQLDYLSRDVIAELIGTDAAFGFTLGDLVGDDLSLFEPLNRAIARIGVPWYPVIGNHDMNYDAVGDEDSDESYERVYGPSTYAFEYARAHFLVLDDVVYGGARPRAALARRTTAADSARTSSPSCARTSRRCRATTWWWR